MRTARSALAWTDTWLKARAWFESKLAGLPVEHHLRRRRQPLGHAARANREERC